MSSVVYPGDFARLKAARERLAELEAMALDDFDMELSLEIDALTVEIELLETIAFERNGA